MCYYQEQLLIFTQNIYAILTVDNMNTFELTYEVAPLEIVAPDKFSISAIRIHE